MSSFSLIDINIFLNNAKSTHKLMMKAPLTRGHLNIPNDIIIPKAPINNTNATTTTTTNNDNNIIN